VPARAWSGYHRFCPLARALDIIGERWTLIVVQELLKGEHGYASLYRRLPGCSPNVLSDRLRTLQRHGVVELSEGRTYRLTDRGRDLAPALEALRLWGLEHLMMGDEPPDSSATFDTSYMRGSELVGTDTFELVVDDRSITLSVDGGKLVEKLEPAGSPTLSARTSMTFMREWARGTHTWNSGVATGEVQLLGDTSAWERMQAAMGYLQSYDPDAARPG
jgi:DNA-binding HxlR family transcriptional regulator